MPASDQSPSNTPVISLKRGRWWCSDKEITASSTTPAKAFQNWQERKGLARKIHPQEWQAHMLARDAAARADKAEQELNALKASHKNAVDILGATQQDLRNANGRAARLERDLCLAINEKAEAKIAADAAGKDNERLRMDIFRLERGWHRTSCELLKCKKELRALKSGAAPIAEQAGAVPRPIGDPERRLALLREMGGDAIYRLGRWRLSGVSALVREERAAGRKRCSENTIRYDLKAAAWAEERRRIKSPHEA